LRHVKDPTSHSKFERRSTARAPPGHEITYILMKEDVGAGQIDTSCIHVPCCPWSRLHIYLNSHAPSSTTVLRRCAAWTLGRWRNIGSPVSTWSQDLKLYSYIRVHELVPGGIWNPRKVTWVRIPVPSYSTLLYILWPRSRRYLVTARPLNNVKAAFSMSKSHYDRRPVGQCVLVSSPIWGSWPDIYYCVTVTVFFLSISGAPSDERSDLSFRSQAI
jgi:hypothetical protein